VVRCSPSSELRFGNPSCSIPLDSKAAAILQASSQIGNGNALEIKDLREHLDTTDKQHLTKSLRKHLLRLVEAGFVVIAQGSLQRIEKVRLTQEGKAWLQSGQRLP
jgi:hypothetical protein